jgi:hypothetical protein
MKQARLAFWVLYEQIEDLQSGSTDRKTTRRTPIFHLPSALWEEETELTLPPLLSNEHRSKRRKVGGHSGPFALTKGMVNEVYQLDPDTAEWAEDLRDDPVPSAEDEALPTLAHLLNTAAYHGLFERAQSHVLGAQNVSAGALAELWRLRESDVPADRQRYSSAIRADDVETYLSADD